MRYLLLLVLAVSALAKPVHEDEDAKPKTQPAESKEVQEEPNPKAIVQGFIRSTRAKAYYAALNTDLDGYVTEQEYVDGIFHNADQDGDNKLTIAEFSKPLDDAASLVQHVLNIDQDGDGQVSEEELKAFLKSELKDEKLPEAEKERSQTAAVIEDDLDMFNMTEGELYFIAHDANHDGFVDELETKDMFYMMDLNDNDYVNQTEFLEAFGYINIPVAIFIDIDRNDDGKLDSHEILFAAVHSPHVAEAPHLTTANGKVNTEAKNSKKTKLEKRKGGKMAPKVTKSKRTMAKHDYEDYNITAEDIVFAVNDVNGDGKVTKEEYVHAFYVEDKNDDGEVSREEYQALIDHILKVIRQFVSADSDYDGFIKFREFLTYFFDLARSEFVPTELPKTTTEVAVTSEPATEAPEQPEETDAFEMLKRAFKSLADADKNKEPTKTLQTERSDPEQAEDKQMSEVLSQKEQLLMEKDQRLKPKPSSEEEERLREANQKLAQKINEEESREQKELRLKMSMLRAKAPEARS